MTSADINALLPVYLEALLAERLFGWTEVELAYECDGAKGWPPGERPCMKPYVPSYAKMQCMWMVTDAMHARGDVETISYKAGGPNVNGLQYECHWRHAGVWAWADTMPLAVARATLAALEGSNG